MFGSTFGNIFKITTWGESHGAGIGVVIDGCPAGLPLCEEDIQAYLDRRKPGQSRYTTQRKESDRVEILSGVFEGKTTGTPISLIVANTDQRSHDYSEIANYYRPGHADRNYDVKYGFRDYRGGGRSSGRETIGRVAAGAVAAKILRELGVEVCAYTLSIGPVSINRDLFDFEEIQNNALFMPDAAAAKEASAYLEKCMSEKNSAGGMIECKITGVPAGIGERFLKNSMQILEKPSFPSVQSNLLKSVTVFVSLLLMVYITTMPTVWITREMYGKKPIILVESPVDSVMEPRLSSALHSNRLHPLHPFRKVLPDPEKNWIFLSKDVMIPLLFHAQL